MPDDASEHINEQSHSPLPVSSLSSNVAKASANEDTFNATHSDREQF